MYGSTGIQKNWSGEEKTNIANTKLGQFLSSGLSEKEVKSFLSQAYNVSMTQTANSSGRTEFSSINVDDILLVGALAKLGMKVLTSTAAKGVGLADDAFVHITTPAGARNILSKGLDPEISGFVTKWKYVKNVTSGSDFNTILYSQKLWPQTIGKFDNGFNILHINAKPTFFSPRTNWVNGIPQYKFNSLVDPSLINLVK